MANPCPLLAAYHASHLEGDFVDCGVNTGLFSRAVMEYVNFNSLNKKYYLLDTFVGLDPKYSSTTKCNAITRSATAASICSLRRSRRLRLQHENHQGPVPDTLSQVDTDKVAYMSIDMNCVIPEVAALEFFWDRMTSAGLIILDDYAYPGAEEQKRAHDQSPNRRAFKY